MWWTRSVGQRMSPEKIGITLAAWGVDEMTNRVEVLVPHLDDEVAAQLISRFGPTLALSEGSVHAVQVARTTDSVT